MAYESLSIEDYRKLINFGKKMKVINKYNAKPCAVDGFRFDSIAEADYYNILKCKVKFNEISFFIRQTPFHLPGNTRLVLDFIVFNLDGSFQVMDVKGEKPTPSWSSKRKILEAIYPIKIEIVTKKEINKIKKRYLL
jgi:Protein of unknown function (DUF1064)